MNQTKKRLSIINFAISITDIETIQLQILKLCLLKTDEKIQNIITMLQAENYAQAQGLITTYIETPTENVLQRSSQEKKHIITEEEQSTIDEFQLFVAPEAAEERVEIDINDFMSDYLHISAAKSTRKEIDINDFLSVTSVTPPNHNEINDAEANDFNSLLNIDADDVLSDNTDLNISYTEKDNFFTLPSQENKGSIDTSCAPKDTFFDVQDEEVLERKIKTIDAPNNTLIQNTKIEETEIKIEEVSEVSIEETLLLAQDDPLQKNLSQEEALPKEHSPLLRIPEKAVPAYYKGMPYIKQKLESMNKQYPSSHASNKQFSALTNLLKSISQEEYREEEIEKTLMNLKQLMKEQQFSQAGQLLLACAATPSSFAQLILARELYKGVLLTQNIPQAFIILSTLAMDDYPEALCDLGQFYEHGIGTKKDKKRAQELYKEAMELGIKRASAHYDRMQKSRKGFFRS